MGGSNTARDSRSVSQDAPEDSETEYQHTNGNHDPSNPSAPGKPGRKKNPNSQAARRDQNRIAQREFRLRKQQRIRDLEARVEILSGSKDETFSELRAILRDILQENQTLRTLLRNLGNFIGDGIGGVVPKLGFERTEDFITFVNKAESDAAFEGYRKRKLAGGAASSPGVSSSSTRKRSTEEAEEPTQKRVKTGNGMGTLDVAGKQQLENDGYGSLLGSMTSAAPSYYPSTNRPAGDIGLFTELLQGQNSGPTMFMANSPSDGSQTYGSNVQVANSRSYAPSYPSPSSNHNVQSSFNSHMYMANPVIPLQNSSLDDDDDRPDDPKMNEAMKLIHYHLDNYKRNNAYCLPQSLRPTLVQRTVPHESIIDGMPHPELRDRLILLRGQFDLVDCLHDLRTHSTLHGDDVLAHSNWEMGESWLRRYGFLVDQPLLDICNRWRRERGEPELALSDIAPAETSSQ